MSEKRFGYGETVLFEWVEEDGEIISTKECVQKLNEQQDTIGEQKIAIDELITDYKKLEEENEQLQKELEKVKLLNESLGLVANE